MRQDRHSPGHERRPSRSGTCPWTTHAPCPPIRAPCNPLPGIRRAGCRRGHGTHGGRCQAATQQAPAASPGTDRGAAQPRRLAEVPGRAGAGSGPEPRRCRRSHSHSRAGGGAGCWASAPSRHPAVRGRLGTGRGWRGRFGPAPTRSRWQAKAWAPEAEAAGMRSKPTHHRVGGAFWGGRPHFRSARGVCDLVIHAREGAVLGALLAFPRLRRVWDEGHGAGPGSRCHACSPHFCTVELVIRNAPSRFAPACRALAVKVYASMPP